MKRILLVSNYVFHYRQKVYNYFAERFDEEGYEFHVLSNEFQDAGYSLKFLKHQLDFKITLYCKEIKSINPDVVILFLHLSDKIYIPLIHYCKAKKIPVIYWNKPLSTSTSQNMFKDLAYHYIHNTCDALITYTPDMKKLFSKENQSKTFIAYNTLYFDDIDKGKYCAADVKKKYKIKESKVILYVSRMQPYKRPDLLAELFAGVEDVAVVYMGAGMYPELQNMIDEADNLYYLGEKYGEEGNEIFSIADVFSTPGNIGLSVNEALFWNIPIVLLKGRHAAEIYYMKDGKTGFIADDESSFKSRVLTLLANQKELNRMKHECQIEYEKEVSIERMYSGFKEAIDFVGGGIS